MPLLAFPNELLLKIAENFTPSGLLEWSYASLTAYSIANDDRLWRKFLNHEALTEEMPLKKIFIKKPYKFKPEYWDEHPKGRAWNQGCKALQQLLESDPHDICNESHAMSELLTENKAWQVLRDPLLRDSILNEPGVEWYLRDIACCLHLKGSGIALYILQSELLCAALLEDEHGDAVTHLSDIAEANPENSSVPLYILQTPRVRNILLQHSYGADAISDIAKATPEDSRVSLYILQTEPLRAKILEHKDAASYLRYIAEMHGISTDTSTSPEDMCETLRNAFVQATASTATSTGLQRR